ncbi:MAG: hypothetical protein IT424_03095 [Pirellulales bacterium]|nr:hypothetical protein [Pirellulales bacterium]
MQISGRLVIVVTLGVALAMAGGAWLYQFQLSRQAARFWGGPAARLIVASPTVELLELADDGAATQQAAELVAGRAVVGRQDLSSQPGLIHLRHVFTQDSNFDWRPRREEAGESRWAYALRFSDGPQALVVLLSRQFDRLGKLQGDGRHVAVLDSSRPAGAITKYLSDLGVLQEARAVR